MDAEHQWKRRQVREKASAWKNMKLQNNKHIKAFILFCTQKQREILFIVHTHGSEDLSKIFSCERIIIIYEQNRQTANAYKHSQIPISNKEKKTKFDTFFLVSLNSNTNKHSAISQS